MVFKCFAVCNGCGKNRASGENRDSTATVSVETLHRTKVGHWGFPEKAGVEAVDAQVRRPA